MNKIVELNTESQAHEGRSVTPVTDDSKYLDHLKKINDIYYDQIRIADQKAAYIFTFMLAFLVSSAEARSVFRLQRLLESEPLVAALSIFFAAGAVVTLVSAVLVVLPRHVRSSTSLYWKGWATNRSRLLDARGTGDPAYLFGQYLENVDNLAAVNRSKYRFVAIAFRGLMAVILAYLTLLFMA
ncbi:hypothetical protein FQ775_20890 [Nitratireductor mangrovi]|uniref:Pycsar effector protein domain-containing protein n=1 Tax=Nitratireductor mangrovi TaxID=2599600 RepID=A0A5B8L3R9_9HYPH|nr:Pycsar system effector family protein [Nitratireductor mangrovi]QDZ02627.1 hypothetical protein FQ775_20890 [Nitratireductor mangrovi]